MGKIVKVLVTGVGMGIGYGAIKALRREFGNSIKIVGVDAKKLSVGFYMANKSYVVPLANKPSYVPTMIEICKKERIDVVLPCTDHELLPLAMSMEDFGRVGSKVIVSPLDTINTCRDKWLTYTALHNKLPIVRSALPNNDNLEKALQFVHLPAILKPRGGHGSKNIYKINSLDDAYNFIKYIPNPVIQAWIDGREYTVDCLADKEGKILCVVPRVRIETIAGFSSVGMTVRNDKLIRIGKELGRLLKFVGPFNFQVRERDGEPHIIEINPRLAGSANISLEAGVNLAGITVRNALNMDIPDRIDFKDGIIVLRYIENIVITKDEQMAGNIYEI
ncbi:MAG: hypothetical protein DRN88_02250 [Candidatus Hydrothermarchaeota archaeon]|nr:MAG: hypothetical protein DRN88_02250 [Candidatus Hydrothermarchaeota archaeon]